VRYLQYLIDQVRRATENEEYTGDTGIQDEEFIQYFNDAQHRLQAKITAQHPQVFLNDEEINIVSGQSTYNLPSDTYLDNRVHNVEYSSTGNESDYYILDEVSLRRVSPGASGEPSYYVRSTGKILVNPTPNKGTLRVTYTQKIKDLDLRVAQFKEDVLETSSLSATSTSVGLTVDTKYESLREHTHVCIIDVEGNTKVKNIPLVMSNSGFADVTSSLIKFKTHTFLSGESYVGGDYIVGGKDTTTHCTLPKSLERYIIQYCSWKILKRDSSIDSQEAQGELMVMEDDIVASYTAISDDIQNIPVLTDWEDWSL